MKLIVLHRVRAAFLESAEWYDRERQGLGGEFIEAVEEAIINIGEAALRHPIVYRDARRAQVHRFPFGVFFVIRDEIIYVFSIRHMHDNPRKWRRDIPPKNRTPSS